MRLEKPMNERPTADLRKELDRREEMFSQDRCWYCGKTIDLHACQYYREIDLEAKERRRQIDSMT